MLCNSVLPLCSHRRICNSNTNNSAQRNAVGLQRPSYTHIGKCKFVSNASTQIACILNIVWLISFKSSTTQDISIAKKTSNAASCTISYLYSTLCKNKSRSFTCAVVDVLVSRTLSYLLRAFNRRTYNN